ncbi:MAG TPA: helix-turn-helix transcriptional regulator [Ktedonobacteraceae bacterium]|nr:helix-turn-helix transcriptional regulator [Ktedonobacteraceae bacterium]
MEEQEAQKWRDLLAKRIRDPHERQQIALALNISQATLTRWVNGDSKPRKQNLHRLAQVLPEYRALFTRMAAESFDEASKAYEEPENVEIPSIFYARVLNAHCNLPRIIHFSSLCEVILQQALKQLDPQRVGMEITVVQCMYPSRDGKVRSLREYIGQATPPWNRDAESKIMFLGMESLAGFVVTSGRSQAIEKRQKNISRFSVQWVDWEESAMAYPIMRSDRIAGCLLVSSVHPEYFTFPHRQKLIQYYAELLSVIFEPENFYPLADIDLGYMPEYKVQYPHIATFRQRTANMMIARQVNVTEAEHLVWQEIEEELLRKPLPSEIPSE